MRKILLLFIMLSVRCLAQQDIFITTRGPYVELGRSLAWGSSGPGAINNNFIFVPMNPDQGMCFFVYNNNPTSNHTFTLNVYQTGDPQTRTYLNNTSRWIADTIVGTNFSVSPGVNNAALGTAYIHTSAAARVNFSISGSGAAGGTPDTGDLFVVQTTQLSCGPVTGGRNDTVFQSLFKAVTTAPPFASALLNNISQSQHKGLVQLAGGACVAQNVDVAFQGSIDSTNWFEIGTPLTTVNVDRNGALWGVFEADGAYPSLRIFVNGYDNVNCSFTLFYEGSIFPNPANSAVLPKAQSRSIQQKSFNISTIGNNTILTNPFPNTSTGRFICLYGLQFNNTVATAQTVLVTNNLSCGPCTTVLFPASATPAPYAVGPSPIPYFCMARGANFILNLTAATAVTGTVQWRYEDNPQ